MQTLISKHLDRRYEEKQPDLNQNLQQQSIGLQLGTDGSKRKHINEGQKLLNFAVSSAAKVANRDLKSTEEAELELLCSAVDEESFGTAMVDCVLISESS